MGLQRSGRRLGDPGRRLVVGCGAHAGVRLAMDVDGLALENERR